MSADGGVFSTPEDIGLTSLREFDAWLLPEHRTQRLVRVRALAPELKRDFVRGEPAVCIRTLPIARAPYLVSYAFNRACTLPYKYLLFFNRALLVQFRQRGALKSLLFNPTLPERSATAPFFANLAAHAPKWLQRALVSAQPSLPAQLASLGLAPEHIDYLAFDHQHVQDLRPYLGTANERAQFPNAKVLVQRADWESSIAPHPLQANWWIRDSALGADTKRLVILDGSVQLGDGAALLFTPGHTWGNQSLWFRAPETGCYTVSENGICADAYAPLQSKIPGLAAHARRSGEEVILNANTLEGSLDQYNSMILERLMADPSARAPGFVQHFSSSELVHTAVAPGLGPTFAIGAVNEGTVAVESLSN